MHPDFKTMMGQIDYAFVECPHCGNIRKVEWARRRNMMPPQSAQCYRCKQRTTWEENRFYTLDEMDMMNRPEEWVRRYNEDRSTE